jgi:hypothetical protein
VGRDLGRRREHRAVVPAAGRCDPAAHRRPHGAGYTGVREFRIGCVFARLIVVDCLRHDWPVFDRRISLVVGQLDPGAPRPVDVDEAFGRATVDITFPLDIAGTTVAAAGRRERRRLFSLVREVFGFRDRNNNPVCCSATEGTIRG